MVSTLLIGCGLGGGAEAPRETKSDGALPAPPFVLEGPDVGPDLGGDADFRIDFGKVIVDNPYAPELFLVNQANTSSTVRLAADPVGAPFSLPSDEITLPPSGRVPLDISFSPGAEGAFDTVIAFETDGPYGERTVRLVGTGIPAGAALEFGALEDGDFVPLDDCHAVPDTNVEDESFSSLWVRNVSRNPVTLTDVRLEVAIAGMSLHGTPLPSGGKVLAPDGQEFVELELRFSPLIAETYAADVVVLGESPTATPFERRACVRGEGGGARISCNPNELDLGVVEWEDTKTLSFTCTNSGIVPAGSTPQILYVSHLEVMPPSSFPPFTFFSASIRELDGSPGPSERGYLPGESFLVEVTFAPQGPEEILDSALVILHNTSTANPAHQTPVVGRSRAPSP